ncbi:putative ribonuclease H-like domain-containing protein [Tanacetum coccineum]
MVYCLQRKTQKNLLKQQYEDFAAYSTEDVIEQKPMKGFKRYKTGEEYHVVPPPYTRNFMPPKPDLVLADKDEYVFNWISDSENENETEFKSGQRKPSNAKVKFVKSNEHVKSPRESVKKVENNKQAEYPRKNSQSPRVVSDNKGNEANDVKASEYWVWRPKQKLLDHGNPQQELKDKRVIDSGCSTKGGKITRKCKIRTGKLDIEDVYFVKELKFNLFSVSQMCDKKNSVLFTDTECVVLSPNFKLTDESHVLLKVPRKDNMYSIDLKNVVPLGGLTCLFAKATLDESNLWHRRLGHINFKSMNKLKGKQHKVSCKDPNCNSNHPTITNVAPMDLFGLTFIKSIMKKMYCLVVTDDFSRFSWVFFLATKDETSGILKAFITGIENQINHRVKIIRCDNRTEFKNKEMNQFCEMKGIKREFSVARTPQQNRVAERKNKTLIEAARTMLADSKLPTTFWAEAVNSAYYVQNRVLVIKPHNKTHYELLHGRTPSLSFMKPFGCPITILNTSDHLGKFDGKADEGLFVGYSVNSKAFRAFNNRTRIVEENLHITFLENKPTIAGSGPEWLLNIDTLTKSMNYKPVVVGNQTNDNTDTKESIDAGQAEKKPVPSHESILLPLCT